MSQVQLPFSPAAERNKVPILAVLHQVLPPEATVLEIASGTGQHAAHFAASRPGWTWQASDADVAALAGIASRCAGLANVLAPIELDVLANPWPKCLGRYEALYCANMLHISPWTTCTALMHGAARHLGPQGQLVLYGPFIVDGNATAPSNLAFDADLRARDPRWGLRSLTKVTAQAAAAGLSFERRFDMPANNLMLVFRR